MTWIFLETLGVTKVNFIHLKHFPSLCFLVLLFLLRTFYEIIFIYDEAVASPSVAQHAFPSKGQKTEKEKYRAIEAAV